jgi:protein O-GlcNAc transferase
VKKKHEASHAAAASPPLDLASAFRRALELHRGGDVVEAEDIYRHIIAVQPGHFDSLHFLGIARQQRGDLPDAIRWLDAALKINPTIAAAHHNRGLALHALKRLDEALASHDRAIALGPDYAPAYAAHANVLYDMKRFGEAVASYDQAIAKKPDYPEALSNRSVALKELGRFGEAVASCDRALAVRPDYAEALNNRAVALTALHRLDEAIADCGRAIALKPDFAEAFNNRGVAQNKSKRFDESLSSYDRAIALRPGYAEAFNNQGLALKELQRLDQAAVNYERALVIEPDHKYAYGGLADCAIKLCDWARSDALAAGIRQRVIERRSAVPPMVLLGYSADASLQLACARHFIADCIANPPPSLWRGERWRNDKIKIAYLSADLHRHATAFLMAELFERHDRSRFEVTAVSFGPDDGSDMRARLTAAFDRFVDARTNSDEEVARLLHELRIDIAVDLKGHTKDARPGILAFRPAPVQAGYLGFPGTMGADFIDYIIADAIVLPFAEQPYFAEKIVHLPGCYQVNDRKRGIAAPTLTPTRAELGLPATGVVFCGFHNSWKITAPLFDIWMRLLGAVDGSVLWLLRDNGRAAENLCREAAARNVDPARLVFADRLGIEEHLARHRVADLFLDTLPVNAHTTASDALWTGLPVLTCRGTCFAGRVAASLLHAAGLPELVTNSLLEYEALALNLACNPARLSAMRQQLDRNRSTCPLFDTDRFRRHLETAYTTMWETWQRGDSPRSFAVEPAKG